MECVANASETACSGLTATSRFPVEMLMSCGAESGVEDEAEVGMFEPEADAVWGGDAGIYADRDVTADELLEQVSRYQSDPARVVAHIGEKAGFADALGSAG